MWLPGDILLKADKMSMAHSIELRVPYLDRHVMEEAAKLPPEYKINGINTKYIFRKAANRSLPNEWADRTKKGFPVPIRKWLREDKYYGRREVLLHIGYRRRIFRSLRAHAASRRSPRGAREQRAQDMDGIYLPRMA